MDFQDSLYSFLIAWTGWVIWIRGRTPSIPILAWHDSTGVCCDRFTGGIPLFLLLNIPWKSQTLRATNEKNWEHVLPIWGPDPFFGMRQAMLLGARATGQRAVPLEENDKDPLWWWMRVYRGHFDNHIRVVHPTYGQLIATILFYRSFCQFGALSI